MDTNSSSAQLVVNTTDPSSLAFTCDCGCSVQELCQCSKITVLQFQQVCNRLNCVRIDVSNQLRNDVWVALSNILQKDVASDSEGHSSEGHGRTRMTNLTNV